MSIEALALKKIHNNSCLEKDFKKCDLCDDYIFLQELEMKVYVLVENYNKEWKENNLLYDLLEMYNALMCCETLMSRVLDSLRCTIKKKNKIYIIFSETERNEYPFINLINSINSMCLIVEKSLKLNYKLRIDKYVLHKSLIGTKTFFDGSFNQVIQRILHIILAIQVCTSRLAKVIKALPE